MTTLDMLPARPFFAPILLPGDLPSLPAGAPYEMAVLSATYGVSPQLRPLRKAARGYARRLLVDPRTAHFQYEGYMSMEDYRALPYSPGRTTLGTLWEARDFQDRSRRQRLIEEVLEVQREMGADLLLAPYFSVPAVDHPWLEVALEAAVESRQSVNEEPLGAVVHLELDALLSAGDRDRLVTAFASLRPDFFWVVITDFDEVTAWPDEAAAVADLVDRLGADTPLVLAHAGRTGLVAIAAGARGYAAGSYQLESFPKRYFREGLVNLQANTYYDRARSIHMPARLAEAAAATGVAARCTCEFCVGRPVTRMVSRQLVGHALRARRAEVERLGAIAPEDRRGALRDSLDDALDVNRRTRRELEAKGGDEHLSKGAFHYLEVLRELCGGPAATIPVDPDRDL